MLKVPAALGGYSNPPRVRSDRADLPGTVLDQLYLRLQAWSPRGSARNCRLLVTFLRFDCLRTLRPGPKTRVIRRLVQRISRVRLEQQGI